MHFLARFCDCALPTLFALLSRWGLALEPHGQNVVLVLRNGLPTRLLYRDFGSVRVSPARLIRSGMRSPALTGSVQKMFEATLQRRNPPPYASMPVPPAQPNMPAAAGTSSASVCSSFHSYE